MASAVMSACRSWTFAGQSGEFLVLEYLDGDRVYVPVQSLHLVTAIPVRRPRAPRCTNSAPTSGRGRASGLPNRFATSPPSCSICMRAARRSKACNFRSTSRIPGVRERLPFDETEDQGEAIRAVLKDLGGDRPMDRIVCATSGSARPK